MFCVTVFLSSQCNGLKNIMDPRFKPRNLISENNVIPFLAPTSIIDDLDHNVHGCNHMVGYACRD